MCLPGVMPMPRSCTCGAMRLSCDADLAAVEPDAGLPVDPLQKEFHALALPVGGDFDVALIPGRPGVDVRTIEPVERRFRRVRQAEFRFVGRAGQLDPGGAVPRRRQDAPMPFCWTVN